MAIKRKEFTQIAFDVAQRATGEVTAPTPIKKHESGRKVASKKAPTPVKKPG